MCTREHAWFSKLIEEAANPGNDVDDRYFALRSLALCLGSNTQYNTSVSEISITYREMVMHFIETGAFEVLIKSAIDLRKEVSASECEFIESIIKEVFATFPDVCVSFNHLLPVTNA